MNTALVRVILGALVRHALTALGGYGLVASKDTQEFLISLGMLAVGALWSVYQKWTTHRAQHGP